MSTWLCTAPPFGTFFWKLRSHFSACAHSAYIQILCIHVQHLLSKNLNLYIYIIFVCVHIYAGVCLCVCVHLMISRREREREREEKKTDPSKVMSNHSYLRC